MASENAVDMFSTNRDALKSCADFHMDFDESPTRRRRASRRKPSRG